MAGFARLIIGPRRGSSKRDGVGLRVVSTSNESKWTRFPAAGVRSRSGIATISDFFQIKRGLATGHNRYFILSEEEIKSRGLPMETFSPILPSPRYVTEDEVMADRQGNPQIERRSFLLNTKLSEDEIRRCFPRLHAYLEEGKARGLHKRYLCQHRSLWYGQENRPPAELQPKPWRSMTVSGVMFVSHVTQHMQIFPSILRLEEGCSTSIAAEHGKTLR